MSKGVALSQLNAVPLFALAFIGITGYLAASTWGCLFALATGLAILLVGEIFGK